MNKADFTGTVEDFESIDWHDSKLLDLRLAQVAEPEGYNLEIDINLLMKGGDEFERVTMCFQNCRVLKLDLDLLGVIICSGDIGSLIFTRESEKMEARFRGRNSTFGFPEDYLPLKESLCCFIEMIDPGGEILIFANSVQVFRR